MTGRGQVPVETRTQREAMYTFGGEVVETQRVMAVGPSFLQQR